MDIFNSSVDLHPKNLRYFFYIVLPNESYFFHFNDTIRLIDKAFLWSLALIFVETIFLTLTQNHDKFSIADSITSINCGLISQLPKFSSKSISLLIYTYLYKNFHIFDIPDEVPIIFLWVFAFLVQDFMFYLGHRAVHEIGIFWAFHQIHHSSEYLNFSTALRQSIFQEHVLVFFECFQSFITPPPMFYAHKTLNTLYQFWLHTETIPNLGLLEFIFNTPSLHRVHHGRNPYCLDKNYGGVLILWDKIFGTYEKERKKEKPIYGLVNIDHARTFDPIYLQTFAIKEYAWNKPRIKNSYNQELFPEIGRKIQCIFLPPGYFSDIHLKWFFFWKRKVNSDENVPKIEQHVIKYQKTLTFWETFYVTLQFLFLVFVFIKFSNKRRKLGWFEFIVFLVYLISTIQAIGQLLDKKSEIRKWEFYRNSIVILFCFVFKNFYSEFLIYLSIFSIIHNWFLLE